MTKLESEFFDAYKRLDAVCADLFHEKNGVTAYLNDMDTVPSSARQGISSWSYDRSALVRLRHVRNQIAHNAESSSCTKEDLNKLKDFYSRLLQGEDALSKYTRLYAARQMRQKEQQSRPKRNRKKRIRLIIFAVFLMFLIVLACIAFAFLYHI